MGFDQKSTSMGRATMMRIVTSIVATMMLVGLVLAVDHDVGSPNGGWDTSTDLGSWASSKTFAVGDNIGKSTCIV